MQNNVLVKRGISLDRFTPTRDESFSKKTKAD
jgi:hypothetical protein